MSIKKKYYIPDPLPEWFLVIKGKSLLNTKDVMSLFNFKTAKAVTDAVGNGRFIKSDKNGSDVNREVNKKLGFNRIPVKKNKSYQSKCFWEKETILKEIERRKQYNQEIDNETQQMEG